MAATIIHGYNSVSEALQIPGRINRIYIAKESRERNVRPLMDRARAAGVRFDFVPQAKLNDLTGTLEHQGIAAAISPVQYTPLGDLIAACGERALILAADRVQHERNLGMIIRSALGAGACGVIVSDKASALLDETVLRSSAGTALRLPVCKETNLPTALRSLKQHGFWVYGLAAGAADSVFEMQWPERVVLVVGNEAGGLRPGVTKVCDAFVGIPLQNGLDSLNVAVSAAIALFQVSAARQEK